MQNDQGETRTFLVSKLENGKLTVDGNHPFAGKTLTYSVTIKDIRDATDEEMKKGASAPVLH
jgi:FKBP-type peptidyl-prolyl cis-trans isomerase SlyD